MPYNAPHLTPDSLIPLYLTMAGMNFTTSLAAFEQWKNGLLYWNPDLKNEADALTAALKEQGEMVLREAIAREALSRMQHFVEGLATYRQSPKNAHDDTHWPVFWAEGTTRLLDYGRAESALPVLCVPSLINRARILDLTPQASMLQFLNREGFRPMLLDWGDPGEEEASFGFEDYVNRISRAMQAVDEPVVLAGYCMGGLMAVATALQDQSKVKGLALLATPWDFHSADSRAITRSQAMIDTITGWIDEMNGLPPQVTQALFYGLNPWDVHKKYMRFAEGDWDEDNRKNFLAREQWLNEGVHLVTKVAQECFINWPINNLPMAGQWKINNQFVNPAGITIPSFFAIPEHDVIVPPLCARALAELIPGSMVHSCPSGHIGMVAGMKARDYLWQPLANWLKTL